MSFDAAEEECLSRGGHLASLHSVAEAEDIYSAAGKEDSWLGLRKVNGAWTWTDGSSYGVDIIRGSDETSRWRNGHGDNGGGKICGRWGWKPDGDWDDVHCSEVKPATCKICSGEYGT